MKKILLERLNRAWQSVSTLPVWLQLVLIIGFIAVLPPFIGGYWTHVLAYVGIYVMLGIGLNVVVGFAGLLDLGYVAFYAVGGHTLMLFWPLHILGYMSPSG